MMTTKYALNEKAERPWGWWEVLNTQDTYVVKRFCLKPGKRISLQTHTHRSEHWVVVEGTAKVTLSHSQIIKNVNDAVFIPVGEFHRIENIGLNDLVIIEIQAGDLLDETDIVRYNEDYTPCNGDYYG
ncbi:MAG: phosphomannose isomerase type II C-terminal cupin domain [Alphaproteobacteria bacterium]|nr:phosphomannose isomerase type II C-terminal cupin domain [Alphaproteobacteria bacterium]